MTLREQQIFSWIKENPTISQEELAQKAGITRSSVAVHISNLMKKGMIAGRGYVLPDSTYVVTVGGVNVDIGGRPFRKLISHDSNPGRVRLSPGGVGRNISHNMSLLGLDVRFLTALGDDPYAQKIELNCRELGIDISQARKIRGATTSSYLFINDEKGDMALAVADMEICDQISPSYLATKLTLLNHARLVVVDTNIPAESLMFLAEHCTSPIFADPVSVTKAEKIRPIMNKIDTIKPNRLEAELFTGIEIRDAASCLQAAEELLRQGVKHVFLTLGEQGVLAADSDEHVFLPCLPAQVRNTTGAGDAFMAALAWARLKGLSQEESARAASAAAAIAVESDETVNPELSEERLRERMRIQQ